MERNLERAAIRAAGPWDAGALANLHIRTWREAFAQVLPAPVLDAQAAAASEQWERRLAEPGHASFWVAERRTPGDEPGEAMVGFAWAEAVGPGQVRALELVGLYVLADYYGTGVADDLLTCAVGEAPCQLWVAGSNHRAQNFYRRHGFATDGASREVADWGGITVLRMVR